MRVKGTPVAARGLSDDDSDSEELEALGARSATALDPPQQQPGAQQAALEPAELGNAAPLPPQQQQQKKKMPPAQGSAAGGSDQEQMPAQQGGEARSEAPAAAVAAAGAGGVDDIWPMVG
jgi:hypothetical protein